MFNNSRCWSRRLASYRHQQRCLSIARHTGTTDNRQTSLVESVTFPGSSGVARVQRMERGGQSWSVRFSLPPLPLLFPLLLFFYVLTLYSTSFLSLSLPCLLPVHPLPSLSHLPSQKIQLGDLGERCKLPSGVRGEDQSVKALFLVYNETRKRSGGNDFVFIFAQTEI